MLDPYFQLFRLSICITTHTAPDLPEQITIYIEKAN